MKSIFSALLLILSPLTTFAAQINCNDPHTGIEVSIAPTPSGRASYIFKIPVDFVSVPGIPKSSAGFYEIKGNFDCNVDPANGLLAECFTEKESLTLTNSENGAFVSFHAVVSFSLAEVTTRHVGGSESIRRGNVSIFGHGLELSPSLQSITFGNLAGTGVEGRCELSK